MRIRRPIARSSATIDGGVMLELTSSYAATSDRLEAELATVRRITSTVSAEGDLQALERYRMEIEAELERLQRTGRAAA